MKNELIVHTGKKTYTLCYTARTVERARRLGFRLENLNDAPIWTLSVLIHSAFWAHHPRITENQVFSEIFPLLPRKREFIETLEAMYAEKEAMCKKAGRI